MARRLILSWCSHKKITFVVGCVNLVAVFFVLRSLFGFNFGGTQARRMQESVRIRGALESSDLVNTVSRLRKELDKKRLNLPQSVKQKLAFEILQKLNNFSDNNVTEQRAIVELWRTEKLEEIKRMKNSKLTSKSSSYYQEVEMLKRALDVKWPAVMEDIGLWIPHDVINTVHDDKPANEQEYEDYVVTGRPLPANCNAEPHTDYDGAAVRWGLTHHKATAADCCEACLEQAKRAKPGEMKCNIWVYCPSENGCYSPDIYEHKHQECWLKEAEVPRLNFKHNYSESYRSKHPTAPLVVPWISGVVRT